MSEARPLNIQLSDFDIASLWGILGISLLALLFAGYLVRQVLAQPEGTEAMKNIARAIQEGSRAYLRRQFRTVAFFVVLLTFGLLALPAPSIGVKVARSVAFLLGAGFSAIIGFVGMTLAVRGNVRVANAARESLRRALTIAFRTGGIAGMFTVGLGLLGATAIFLIYKGSAPQVLVGFGFGGALLAMFMRVGGGIFTKSADVGADLVGKVEKNIPEDDPRNAATIADNVGDNVGDCAGMAADLFESYEVTLVAAIILGFFAFQELGPAGAALGVMFPLFVRAIGVITSMVGIFAVSPRSEDEHGMKTINRGFFISAGLSAVVVYLFSDWYMGTIRPALAVVLGLVLAAAIQLLTEHYTSTERGPVKEIARSTTTGPATTIISGFSVGLESTVWAIVAIAGAIFGAFVLGSGRGTEFSLYMIALTGMGMLTTVGVVVSMDTFGPVSDNAHGIAEMVGGLGGRADKIMADLDAVGNTTKAITKGLAIATAVLAATSLFGSYRDTVLAALGRGSEFFVDIARPEVLVGLLLGGAVPFLFSSLTIGAVGRGASAVVEEVRRQFREHPGIMDYKEKPDYARVVDISTKTALQELVTPGLLAVLTPIVVGFALGHVALGAFLGGSILTGQLLAVMLSNAGGAWDNAKKFIEDGNYGGKGSESHKAGVIGDTVGDPFKDTAGPALNPLIKVMNLVALLVAGSVVRLEPNGTVRASVVVVGVAILAIAVYVAKSRTTKDLAAGGELEVAETGVPM